jgi:hypothetical protein
MGLMHTLYYLYFDFDNKHCKTNWTIFFTQQPIYGTLYFNLYNFPMLKRVFSHKFNVNLKYDLHLCYDTLYLFTLCHVSNFMLWIILFQYFFTSHVLDQVQILCNLDLGLDLYCCTLLWLLLNTLKNLFY